MTNLTLEKKIDICQKHIINIQNEENSLEIESFLVHFLLIEVCSGYEMKMKEIILSKIKQTKDKEVISYVDKSIKKSRNIKVNKIKEVLNKFNKEYGVKFDSKLKGKESLSNYISIVSNRDASAHGNYNNMTLKELLKSYNSAKEVLNTVKDTINNVH